MNLAFLPELPPPVSQLMAFGLLLALGVLAGEAVRRYLALPRIMGYVLAGALLGPQASGLLDGDALFELRLLVDLSIGLVVFELGSRLDFEWLRANQWLFPAALAEALFCFFAIYAGLVWFGFAPLLSATAAAIGTATSPAVVLLVAKELQSEGQVTERMLLFTTVNTVFAYMVLALLLPFLHLEHKADWRIALLHPLYVFVGAALAGWVASVLLRWLARWVGKDRERQFVLIAAVVVVAIGVAHSLKISVAVTLVTLGMLARNLDRGHALLPVDLGRGGQLFIVILFVLAGASLEFGALEVAALAAVLAFVVLRFAGKAVALLVFGRLSGIPSRSAGLLALALLPMSGVAVVMVRDTISLYPEFGRALGAIVLSAVVILELVGPLATQFALKKAGEARPEERRAA